MAMREPKPLSPKDIAKGMGPKTPPSKRVGPGKPKQPLMPKAKKPLAKKPMMPMMPKAKNPKTQNQMMKKSSSKGSMY